MAAALAGEYDLCFATSGARASISCATAGST
jgi:hypothetical protein